MYRVATEMNYYKLSFRALILRWTQNILAHQLCNLKLCYYLHVTRALPLWFIIRTM